MSANYINDLNQATFCTNCSFHEGDTRTIILYRKNVATIYKNINIHRISDCN